MKKQNSVYLSGELADVTCETVLHDGRPAPVVRATLVTDHPAYGGHHRVLFVADHALEVQAYWNLLHGQLEVTVEGWLRSAGGSAVVMVDRVMILNADKAQRAAVQRAKAAAKQGGGSHGDG